MLDSASFENLKNEMGRARQMGFKIATGSMQPLIKAGDLIHVGTLDTSVVARFDILVFWDGTRLVCHYLWHVNQLRLENGLKVYITRSLNPSGEDMPFSEDRILGRVTNFRIPTATRVRLVIAALVQRWRQGLLSR